MATKPKTQIMSHDDTVMSPITKASNVLFEDGKTAQDKLEDNVEKSFTPSVENSSSMFKVGQGDNVDYSGNVVDGAYVSCVLKGKTMVNCIQEPSSQDVVLPYDFTEGQYVTINDTKESGALSVELKGQTLVNHCPSSIYKNESWSVGAYKTYSDFPTLIKGKTYTFYAPLGSKNGNPADALINLFITTDNTNKGIYHTYSNSHDTILKTFTMGDRLRFENSGITGERFQQNYPMVMILEGEWTSETLPGYFEGMKSVKAPTVKTVGKNLFDIANSSNGYFSLSNPYGLAGPDFSNKTSAYIKVKPNTQYSYSFDGFAQSQVGNLYWTGFYYYKRVGEVSTVHPSRMTFTGVNQISFTTPSDCNYIRIGSRGLMLDGATVQLEESTTATTYKPYTSSSLTLPEEVILRSLPNGVCDTYNTRTGEYVKRIGEKTLNGSESWGVWQQGGDHLTQKTVVGFGLNLEDAPTTKSFYVLCDRFATGGTTSGADNDHSYYVYHKELIYGYYANASTYRRLGLSVSKTKLGIPNDNTDATQALVSLRAYLASNPIKVQYELATPIITKLPLQSTLKPWNTTTHIYTEIPQNSLYPILSHSNPTYPVILKPSTKYSIVANSYSNNHTNSPINFNLGGATASTTVGNRVTMVTTPSTLSNELLTMSGRGNKLNNIMVIEGDVVGDEPYFEGICDVKSPVVKNVGKNLFVTEKHKFLANYGNYYSIDETSSATNEVKYHLEPNCQYVFSFKKYGTDACWVSVEIDGNYSNNNNRDYIKWFTTNSTGYAGIKISANGGNDKGSKIYDIMLRKATDDDIYEQHNSNTTTFNQKDGKIIVLRSLPNGVCDTLNVETGEYVRRIGEVVLNGSEGWSRQYSEATPLMSCNIEDLIVKEHKMWCDKLQNISIYSSNANMGICSITGGSKGSLRVRTPLVLNGQTVTDFKAWLQANPITVQYELATPIISTIDVQGFPYAYKDGHVQLSSSHTSQSLTPKVEYSLPINRNGQIRMNQVMVEKHQKHIDKLQAMIITNMVNTQYRQSLTKINYQLGGE